MVLKENEGAGEGRQRGWEVRVVAGAEGLSN